MAKHFNGQRLEMTGHRDEQLLVEFCLALLKTARVYLPGRKANSNEDAALVRKVTDALYVDHQFAPGVSIRLVHRQHISRFYFGADNHLLADSL